MPLYIAAAPEIALRLAARCGLSLLGELFFVYLFAHGWAVRILRTGYLFLFIFRLVQLRILLEEYQTAADDLNDLGLRLCRNLFGNFARGLGCCLEQDLELEQFAGAECVERLGYQCVIDAALADLKKRLERICLRAKRGSLFACHIISSSFFARSLNALPLWLMLSFSSAVSCAIVLPGNSSGKNSGS